MNNLSKEQILKLCKEYDSENQWDSSLEKQLGSNFRTSKEISKEELKDVIKWKFNDNKARLKRELNVVQENDDTIIRELCKLLRAGSPERLWLSLLAFEKVL